MERVKGIIRENWLTLVIVGVMAIAYFALKSSPTELANEQAFWAGLESADTTVVYLYANT